VANEAAAASHDSLTLAIVVVAFVLTAVLLLIAAAKFYGRRREGRIESVLARYLPPSAPSSDAPESAKQWRGATAPPRPPIKPPRLQSAQYDV
jgi:hypothetical protein